MSTSDRSVLPKFEAADAEVASYRALSSLAVVGLLVGLLSWLALFDTMFWLAPLAAVVISAVALRRIKIRTPELVGRSAALIGLMLGVTFLVAAPVDDLVYQYFLRQQARQFAEIWIDSVRHREVYKAHHVMLDPKRRRPVETKFAEFYRASDNSRRLLMDFLDEPVVRTLFALGPAATIRYYETTAQGYTDSSDAVRQTYAVTYPDEQHKPKTFFISLLMQRTIDATSGRASWTLMDVKGGIRPPGW
jgi:hypothetical protein